MVEHVKLEGEKAGTKIDESQIPESHKKLISQTPTGETDSEEVTRKVIQRLVNRAFRRPATQEEVERWVGIAQQVQADGEAFEASIQVVLQGLLLSPQFLFRIEKQRPAVGSTKYAELDEFEVATRISYFLWSTMPMTSSFA
jgi:hypothetical protein